MLTALPDAANDLTLPCHEQRAGAATGSKTAVYSTDSSNYDALNALIPSLSDPALNSSVVSFLHYSVNSETMCECDVVRLHPTLSDRTVSAATYTFMNHIS